VILFQLALLVLVAGGAAALLARRRPRAATGIGVATALVGAALGLVPALAVLAGAELSRVELPWSVPGGRLALAIDPLSAFFLVPIFALSALAAPAGAAALREEGRPEAAGPAWLWFHWLTASMALVATAQNAVLFLVAWEGMALASALLVGFHHEREEVRSAALTTLVATHLGSAFLMALFALLGRESGSLDFASFRAPESGAGVLFLLALVGFGAKAGLFPLHVWLPEAHPAAPSHVSALLSGAMIKTGLYGLLRSLAWLGPPPAWWGALLILVGALSAVLGILFALAQRDLKRLLAYSSVENAGIASLGIGLGLLGASAGQPWLAALGLAGGLLHVWTHALAKGLLFLGAGSLAHAAHTLDLERMGGLLRRMPATGAAFLVGAASICALPPFAGFASELLLTLACFRGLASPSAPALPLAAALIGLGASGGLAAACFAKACGVALLGEPRSPGAREAREAPRPARAAVLILAGGCALLGVASPLALAAASGPVELLARAPAAAAELAPLAALLWRIGAFGAGVLALAGLAFGLRALLLRGRAVAAGPTWDCGYGAPTSRMQYTASSFAQPLTRLFEPALGTAWLESPPQGLFPGPARLATRVPDLARERLFDPLFAGVEKLALRLGWLQSGSTHQYVLYLLLATAALVAWKLG
jgi:formate hydrogenlyase subunit 3/multisubunit Na+/H+ antiporter MnhD subunit